MSYHRTPEHRALRAEEIRGRKPWEKSMGPTSAEGMAKVARNGDKGAVWEPMRILRRVLRELDDTTV